MPAKQQAIIAIKNYTYQHVNAKKEGGLHCGKKNTQ